MSSSSVNQQSLADGGSETLPLMLKRGSYIPWASRFRQRPETEDDLTGDNLKPYEAEIKVMILILISTPNDIYNSVDSCQTANEMWLQVKCLMQGTELSKLMNDLKRNKIELPTVTINTKFLNCLQPKWYKYVTNVRLAKNLTKDPYDELFDHLQQYEKLFIAIRAKNLEKNHDPLALVIHTTVVQVDRVNIQRRNVRNDGRIARRSYNIQEEYAEGSNVQKETGNVQRTLRTSSAGNYFMEQMLLAEKDEAGVFLSNEHNDFLIADAAQLEEIKELSANICMMAIIQSINIDFDEGPSYDSAFISEEEGDLMRRLIDKGPYERKSIPNPNKESENIPEPISKMTELNKQQYFADIKRITTLINVMDRNRVRPSDITINTKFLNSLQPEWSKYVIMTRQKFILKTTQNDQLYDHLSQFEPHVNSSKVKKAARNHDSLALVANSHAHSSHSHASPSYSHSPQPYYVTHPSS
ncbi:hypothetical protein Tco_0596449, partial [Tanacetum coccineum]